MIAPKNLIKRWNFRPNDSFFFHKEAARSISQCLNSGGKNLKILSRLTQWLVPLRRIAFDTPSTRIHNQYPADWGPERILLRQSPSPFYRRYNDSRLCTRPETRSRKEPMLKKRSIKLLYYDILYYVYSSRI